MQRLVTIAIGILCLLFAILSARLDNHYLAYGVVACAIIAVVLSAWNKLDTKYISILIYSVSLAFLYQSTLISDNLIGTDIHTEYYIYQQALNGWNINYPHAYNTSIGSTLIAPFLTNTLHINGYFIYKAIYPALFAILPVLLYKIYSKEFNHQIAFIACTLFVTVPTYLLEMIGLPRQMLGELMLGVVMVLVILQPVRNRYLLLMLLCFAILGYLFHYVMGLIIFGFMLCSAVVILISKFIHRYGIINKPKVSIVAIVALAIVPAITGFFYYNNVANGEVIKNYVTSIRGTATQSTTITTVSSGNTEIDLTKEVTYFEKQEPLIRTALGIDFMQASIVGKIFRIFQYIIEILLVVGCFWLIFKRKQLSIEYISFAIAAIIILAACIFILRFSNIINATRFYHIAMFILAPLIVIGGLVVFRNLKVLTIAIIVPYMLLTTGVAFELAQETNISNVNAPYSIALSNYRINAVPEFTDNDAKVAKYITNNKIEPVLTDINGMLLLSQTLDPFEYIHRSPNTLKYYQVTRNGESDLYGQNVDSLTHGWGFLPQDVTELSNTYIFLTSDNVKSRTVTFKPNWYHMTDTASGMRQAYSFDYVKLMGNYKIVFKVGNSILIKENPN